MTAISPRAIQQRYQGDEERPLGGYVGAISTYGALVVGFGAVVRARSLPVPDRVTWSDLAMVSVATHKASRLLAKDAVTSPLRAPFTKFKGPSGDAEVAEEVIGTGAQHAIGELITCPFCLAQWVATAFVAGLVVAPRVTRLAAAVFTAVAASDLLQLVYDKAKN
jgi:hypothetical protein